jgi:hypothetical protein
LTRREQLEVITNFGSLIMDTVDTSRNKTFEQRFLVGSRRETGESRGMLAQLSLKQVGLVLTVHIALRGTGQGI